MNNEIDNCFDNHGATFYKDVYCGNDKIGKIRALRPLDRDMLQPYLGDVSFDGTAPVYRNLRPEALRIARLVISLGGMLDTKPCKVGDEGWVFNEPVNKENINRLKLEYFECFDTAVRELEEAYSERREAVRKN
ncbi:MAG: hypothetical protein K8S56_02395 [Candidatus Cloacimonetes bacterium]|nr:hypothetical protein [Candidatus Cloacimonadota bacterium]